MFRLRLSFISSAVGFVSGDMMMASNLSLIDGPYLSLIGFIVARSIHPFFKRYCSIVFFLSSNDFMFPFVFGISPVVIPCLYNQFQVRPA